MIAQRSCGCSQEARARRRRCARCAGPTRHPPRRPGIPPALARRVGWSRLLGAVALPAAQDEHAAIAAALLDAGAPVDARAGTASLTPLMIARVVGATAVADVLLARGANAELRDAWGRTADRLTVFRTAARLLRACTRLPVVAMVHVGQVLAVTNQVTSPVVGLTLTGALPDDALAGWPADDPIVALAMGDDAMSRLLRLTAPVYTRPAPSGLLDIATTLAVALGGEVRAVPRNAGADREYAVLLPSGAAPLRVHAAGVTLATGWTWREDTDAPLSDITTAARAWGVETAHGVTALELALDVAATLAAELDAAFVVTPHPSPATATVSAPQLVGASVEVAACVRARLVRERWRAVAAVRAALGRTPLTTEGLVAGRRYRVLADVGDLKTGAIVSTSAATRLTTIAASTTSRPPPASRSRCGAI